MRQGIKGALACLMMVFLILISYGNVFSESKSDRMHIGAAVLPEVDYAILQDYPGLEVTEADLKNGYKDIAEGTLVSIFSNNPDGYILSVCGVTTEAIASISVKVDNNLYEITSYGCTEIYSPYRSMQKEIKRLAYRVYFTSDAQSGYYKLPIVLNAYPL